MSVGVAELEREVENFRRVWRRWSRPGQSMASERRKRRAVRETRQATVDLLTTRAMVESPGLDLQVFAEGLQLNNSWAVLLAQAREVAGV